jgi:uncharacterized membrane protein YebE (DUF533 family)
MAGIAALGYYAPWVALGLLLLAVVAGASVLVASIFVVRAVRSRSRQACARCDYRPLRIARICPKCHTPTLVTSTRHVAPATAEAMVRTAIAAAWIDGEVTPAERDYLAAILDGVTLDPAVTTAMREAAGAGLAPAAIGAAAVPAAERERILETAASMIVADEVVSSREQRFFDELAAALEISQRRARGILARYRAAMP